MVALNAIKLLGLVTAASLLTAGSTTDDKNYREEVSKWRAAAEARLTAPEGWLSVDGLFWLSEGENSLGSDPASKAVLPADSAPAKVGILTRKDNKVFIKLFDGVVATIGDKQVTEQELRTDANGSPDKVKIGDAIFKIIARGTKLGVRLYNPNCKNRKEFTGRKWFEIDPAYRIEADFHPYDPPKQLMITTVLGDTAPVENPGYAEFKIGGKTYRLEAESAGDGLFFNIHDKTSGKTTYPASRFLDADKPVNGKVILDFNKAVSPPCAFTDYATCPLPPVSNRLSVEIRAGERYEHKD